MDKTYINASHTDRKSWNDDTNEGMLAKYSEEPRLIIVHAGGSENFVNEAYLP